MGNAGIYVGLDIGTTSIKVIVSEYVNGQLNVIGIGNERSVGLNRGIVVDIDKAVVSVQKAIKQAEEKANIQINEVHVGIPANLLQIIPCNGMIAVSDESKEITNEDVVNVASAALVQNLPPERDIIDIIADEFVVDGFDGIKDPRGMIGVRLEMHGSVYTGPKTIIHNLKKCVENAGLTIRETIVNPLALASVAMSDGERDFGTVLIDLGGGQTTASVIHDHKLKFTYVDQEGGDFVTKDISVVLNTSVENAEKLKRNYGFANSDLASEDDIFPVDVVGQSEPLNISEKYLSEIIEARISQILDKIKNALDATKALDLPGGVILTGGLAALPGISELASEILQVQVKTYVPDQMGLRYPSFAQALGLINYAVRQDEVTLLVKSAMGLDGDQLSYSVVEMDNDKPKKQAVKGQAKKTKKPKTSKDPLKSVKNFFNEFFD
ncbi:cell division protein FtsA [Dellaglioa algida]|uniref:Cell division protein FtsA n=1 Tax=Dellaglioa algida DSM 15638 TaxID=1423719 RepID=A0A0R1HIZ9_9LACO|nr:cell division protein FtsA [Dellaglioa algida]KRK46303.1 cell division protein FtsA [Dellaglioa algida DSM 15638]MDK1718230.1 cell division protein FtsA [Dellaglioa algida]MDK1726172.1 cell division protein FtsA [Dellaglioa algida]MDK1727741.1 cell division protein FtsA [Dellaglioa algida]MDK1729000.1 cell division protein FtsA [Dellaglioa algida]